jgi:DNA-directed RNA polymerase
MKYLNMQDGEKVYDYYTYIYTQYGKFKNIEDSHARKLVKKVVMTINYGLTKLGCHRYIFKYLKELNYINSKKDYKEK